MPKPVSKKSVVSPRPLKPVKTERVLARRRNGDGDVAKYDPETQKLLEESWRQETREAGDLQKDAGLARLNVKNSPEEMVVSILAQQRANAYWSEGFSPSNPTGPDCSSNDGETGRGKRLIATEWEEGERPCFGCPLNQFGSRDDGRGKACRNMRVLFVQRLDADHINSPVPELLVVPPTGLKAVANYLQDLIGKRHARWARQTLVTRVESDKSPTGMFDFEDVGPLTAEQMVAIKPRYVAYQNFTIKAASLRLEDTPSTAIAGPTSKL